MGWVKVIKDQAAKALRPADFVPAGLVDLIRYTRDFGGIRFVFENIDGVIVARSTDFRFGSIVTSGKDLKEVDNNIKDAILTAFEIPSAYAAKAGIRRADEEQVKKYVAA